MFCISFPHDAHIFFNSVHTEQLQVYYAYLESLSNSSQPLHVERAFVTLWCTFWFRISNSITTSRARPENILQHDSMMTERLEVPSSYCMCSFCVCVLNNLSWYTYLTFRCYFSTAKANVYRRSTVLSLGDSYSHWISNLIYNSVRDRWLGVCSCH